MMQDIVKERLPKFTPGQAKLVKGSADYIGINQYTASYIKGQKLLQQKPTSYSADWQVQYACEFLPQTQVLPKFRYFSPEHSSPKLCSRTEWQTNWTTGM
jgi:beta-glucosidase